MTLAPAENNRFSPDMRLRRRSEFLRTWDRGKKTHTAHFIVVVAENPCGPTRLGITASRKVGGAIQRNRVKRLVREFFRLHYSLLPAGMDISIIAKKGSPKLDYTRVCEELNLLFSARPTRGRHGQKACTHTDSRI